MLIHRLSVHVHDSEFMLSDGEHLLLHYYSHLSVTADYSHPT